MRCVLWCLLVTASMAACTPTTPPTPAPERPWRAKSIAAAPFAREWAAEDTPLAADLGLGTSAVGDSSILALLKHKLSLPPTITVAILHLPGVSARLWWLRDAETGEMSQALADSAARVISSSPRVHRAVVLPSLILGGQHSVAALREAAARLQADVMVVYRPGCRLYERTPFLGATQYKAVCTLEAVLLDSRSGVIPFTDVVTRGQVAQHQQGDFGSSESLRRAELEATNTALIEAGSRLTTFLAAVPVDNHLP